MIDQWNHGCKIIIVSMYSIHNKVKSVIAERFIRFLKKKKYKYMSSISKNVYVNKLDDRVNKYNIAYHRTIKMKSADVKWSKYIGFNIKRIQWKVLNLMLVKMLEYQNIKIFLKKGHIPNWSGEIVVIKKVKNTVPWTYVISDVNGEEIAWTFYKNELQKTNQIEFRVEKVIKGKGDKLYVIWKGYDNFFNSWIDKKVVV